MEDIDQRLKSLMMNEPHKRFIKAVISRVSVKILDPVSLQPSEVILMGDPKDEPEDSILDLWTPVEVVYFERNNKQILKEGLIVEYNKSIKTEPSVNLLSDEEIDTILNDRFFTLKNTLDKLTSPAPVHRILMRAEQLDKPTKTVKAIQARLSELQAGEYEGAL